MARRSFFSFHYEPDNWRASQVRQMGAIEGNPAVSDNDWEQIRGGGDAAITAWIEGQLSGRSCTVVLIGAATARRKWITYEIQRSWNLRKGVVGIYIHRLKNREGQQTSMGMNPLAYVNVGPQSLSGIAKAYNPPYSTSTEAYNYIKEHIAGWVDEAVAIRGRY